MILLIPAFNPDFRLLQLVDEFKEADIEKIIIINDGSSSFSDRIFEKLRLIPQCTILRHDLNMGKGRALKTGLQYIYDNFPDASGVVTVDCDGQHLPQDVKIIIQKLSLLANSLVLGCRRANKQMPWKSLLGNLLSRFFFFLITGKWLSDTQTGLRGIPKHLIPHLLKVPGNGFDYEFNSLIDLSRARFDFVEVCIQTIYVDKNKSSHFLPITDSFKIFSGAIKSLVNFSS